MKIRRGNNDIIIYNINNVAKIGSMTRYIEPTV